MPFDQFGMAAAAAYEAFSNDDEEEKEQENHERTGGDKEQYEESDDAEQIAAALEGEQQSAIERIKGYLGEKFDDMRAVTTLALQKKAEAKRWLAQRPKTTAAIGLATIGAAGMMGHQVYETVLENTPDITMSGIEGAEMGAPENIYTQDPAHHMETVPLEGDVSVYIESDNETGEVVDGLLTVDGEPIKPGEAQEFTNEKAQAREFIGEEMFITSGIDGAKVVTDAASNYMGGHIEKVSKGGLEIYLDVVDGKVYGYDIYQNGEKIADHSG